MDFIARTFTRRGILLGLCLIMGCAPLSPPAKKGTARSQESVYEEPPTRSQLARYLQVKHLNADTAAATQPYIAFMPFKDKSNFRDGVWPLEKDLPAFFTGYLEAYPEWRLVPYAVVDEVLGEAKKVTLEQAFAAGQRMEADLIIMGTLLDFNLERLSVGDPLLGGYKSYSGVAQIQLDVLRVGDQSVMGTLESDQETVDRGLGLDLLGKPRDQDLQFVNLGKMAFGSDDFKGTAIGQATVQAAEDLTRQLASLIRPTRIRLSGEAAQILSVDAEDVYINIGSQNGVHKGYRFEVYPDIEHAQTEGLDPLRRIGVIEVLEVIGNRLSSVVIIQGEGALRQGDLLKLVGEDSGEEGDEW